MAVFQQRHMMAIVRNILGVMLDHNNRFSPGFIEIFQYPVNQIRMLWIQLGDRFIQDQYIRFQGNGAGQRQQMCLTAGKLPDILLLSAFQPTLTQRFPSPFQIIRHRVIHAGIGCVIQDRRPHDLILKILVNISHFSCNPAHIHGSGILLIYQDTSLELTGNKMWDQTIHRLAECGFSTSIISYDCKKIPFFHIQIQMVQGRTGCTRIRISQISDFNHIHISQLLQRPAPQ